MLGVIGRNLFGQMLVLSLSIHVGLAAWLRPKGDVPPVPFPTQQAPASIRSRASAAVRAEQGDLEREASRASLTAVDLQQVPEPPDLLPVGPRPPIDKTREATEPTRHPVVLPELPSTPARQIKPLALRDADDLPRPRAVAVAPPLPVSQSADPPLDPPRNENTPRRPDQPKQRLPAAVAERTNPEGEAPAASAVSEASANSEASRGAEVEELPQKLTSNPAPVYPPQALAAGLEGRVVIRVRVTADGRVNSADAYKSSGVASLDESALSTVREWKFRPAQRAGKPVPYEVAVPVIFSIRKPSDAK